MIAHLPVIGREGTESMPAMILTTPGTRASLHGGNLKVEIPTPTKEDKPSTHEVHLFDVEQLLVSEKTSVSTGVLCECMRRDIPVLLLSGSADVLGICHAPALRGEARMAQYRAHDDPTICLRWAVAVVEAKILNARRILQRLTAYREEAFVARSLSEMKTLAHACSRAITQDTLRGYEGTAAGRYFEAYGQCFPEDCPFEHRSRRPPHNAANAVLSYTYVLLAAEMECALYAEGLDPVVGFYHSLQDGRASLALDLIEPFRAPIADALAIDLISHRRLKPDEHFEPNNGGIYMNDEGKKRFFLAYERRMTREFNSEHHGQRTTLRACLQNEARAYRKTLLEGSPWHPFRVN